MKPSLQSPDQSHLISCRVYRSVLARRHSLEHSSGVHRQVFQRYEWIVFVSANWGLILHGRDSCFLRAFTLASPMLSQCWNVTLNWGGGVDGTYCTNLFLMQKYKHFPFLNLMFTVTAFYKEFCMWPGKLSGSWLRACIWEHLKGSFLLNVNEISLAFCPAADNHL